jgi:hypothetical protein
MPRRTHPPAALEARRKASLDAVPYRLPVVRREEKNGKVYVTVCFDRPRWQQFLGADETCQRTFGLDAYGRQVYQNCDGQRSVRQIIHLFSKATRVSKPEAEAAVTKFMRTLISKGLIAMQMEKPSA